MFTRCHVMMSAHVSLLGQPDVVPVVCSALRETSYRSEPLKYSNVILRARFIPVLLKCIYIIKTVEQNRRITEHAKPKFRFRSGSFSDHGLKFFKFDQSQITRFRNPIIQISSLQSFPWIIQNPAEFQSQIDKNVMLFQ